jgi:hypothetical protein
VRVADGGRPMMNALTIQVLVQDTSVGQRTDDHGGCLFKEINVKFVVLIFDRLATSRGSRWAILAFLSS